MNPSIIMGQNLKHVKVGKNPFAFEKNAGQPEASYDKTVNICIKAWL